MEPRAPGSEALRTAFCLVESPNKLESTGLTLHPRPTLGKQPLGSCYLTTYPMFTVWISETISVAGPRYRWHSLVFSANYHIRRRGHSWTKRLSIAFSSDVASHHMGHAYYVRSPTPSPNAGLTSRSVFGGFAKASDKLIHVFLLRKMGTNRITDQYHAQISSSLALHIPSVTINPRRITPPLLLLE